MTRSEIAEYLPTVLAWQRIVAQKGLLVSAVERWRDSPRLAFVGAYLAALAERKDCPVYAKNVSELAAQGVSVADPLPKTVS